MHTTLTRPYIGGCIEEIEKEKSTNRTEVNVVKQAKNQIDTHQYRNKWLDERVWDKKKDWDRDKFQHLNSATKHAYTMKGFRLLTKIVCFEKYV